MAMRSLPFIILGGVLLLVGCDSLDLASPLEDETAARAPLLPLAEGNKWILQRVQSSETDTVRYSTPDTLRVTATFEHEGESWGLIVGGSNSPVSCAAGYFVSREDGYYFSATDPRQSTGRVFLKYAYPADLGRKYVLDRTPVFGEGRTTVTVLSTDYLVETPTGEREAYRYRFDVETFFINGVEYELQGTSYERVLVPEIGFVHFDTRLVTYAEEPGSLKATDRVYTWSLIEARVGVTP